MTRIAVAATVGVVGPRDLVESVVRLADEVPSARAKPLACEHEGETLDLVKGAGHDVDAWLFTGVAPYRIALAAGVLDRPAAYLDHAGATLLLAVTELLRGGHDPSRLSVDTLTERQVRETLAEAHLATEDVRVLPYRAGLRVQDVVAFHERSHREVAGVAAVTCLAPVYEALRDRMPAVRLTPSAGSVRAALQKLLLEVTICQHGDAQVALGIVELGDAVEDPGRAPVEGLGRPAEEDLRHEVGMLGGRVLPRGSRQHLIVTTRGPLERATGSFTRLPMLARLSERHGNIRVGFGLGGGSAAEAESLAGRALLRARAAGPVAAAVAFRGDTDILLEVGGPAPLEEENLPLLAQRVGLSKATMLRLRALVGAREGAGITTRDVAEHLAVQPRTARRVLNRLERAGVAETIGTRPPGGSGRPLLIYRVHL